MKMNLSRRTFLKGAGAALGLPAFEAMGDEERPPVRSAYIYFPNGCWMKNWIPEKTEADFELPFSLKPLEKHRRDVLVLSGLDKPNSRSGDGHYAKTANYLTGLKVRKTTGKEISVGGVSVDQYCARKIGHLTPLPSLELGIDPVISGIDSNVGYTRLYGSYISWRTSETPVAREINPRLAYQRLFGMMKPSAADPTASRRQEDNRKLLDLVLEDARTLRKKLSRDDQFKLDEYMDSIRAVERRIQFFSQPDPRKFKPAAPDDVAAPAGAPGDHQEHVRLMLDLIVLAFQTDSTRLASFMFANDVSGKNFSALIPGVKGGHHQLSHHQNKKEKYEAYSRINRWHVEQLVYLMEKMKAVREGKGTLLDNVMVMFGSSLSDGNRHSPNDLPILLAGGGGGTIRSGRHIRSAKNTPLCNLYVSMLERMGTPVKSFGDSTEGLKLA